MAEWKRPPYWAIRGERVTEPNAETVGQWYVLLIVPGQESLAAAHLSGRGFGLYIPMRRALVRESAVEACHPSPELVGYVLAYLWGDDIDRARRCPGVTGVLSKANGEPAIIPDLAVRRLRDIEAVNDAMLRDNYHHREFAAGWTKEVDIDGRIRWVRTAAGKSRKPRKSKRARMRLRHLTLGNK